MYKTSITINTLDCIINIKFSHNNLPQLLKWTQTDRFIHLGIEFFFFHF